MDQIVYDGSLEIKKRIFAEYASKKLSVICPKCSEEVIVVLTPEDAIKHQRAPGLYCPNNDFWTIFNFR